jgi:hypothetical protein
MQQYSRRLGSATLSDFVLGGLSFFRVKALKLAFGGCVWQWRLTTCFLVEGIA